MLITWFKGHNRPHGERRTVDLAELAAAPVVTDDKFSLPLFSPVVFRNNYRNGENVEAAHALGFDLDKGNATPEVIRHAFAGMATLFYSSSSHTEAIPRGRALVKLSRAVDATLYRRLWRTVREHVEKRGLPVAREACDPSRAWFIPGHRPGSPYFHGVVAGPLLDVGRLEILARAQDEAEKARRRIYENRTTFSGPYVEAALRRSWNAVAQSGDGARNNELNKAAYSLARLPIAHSTITQVLLDAAKVAGLPASEAEKTIASALRARKAG